jgi:hypothetical protein
MTQHGPDTVDASLADLSDALGKAAEDFRLARTLLDRVRADLAARNTSVARSVVAGARAVIDHLRGADEALRDVVKALETRD